MTMTPLVSEIFQYYSFPVLYKYNYAWLHILEQKDVLTEAQKYLTEDLVGNKNVVVNRFYWSNER